ncbi:MAG: hypothetical protein LIR46_10215 [Bacteroidota bacterium]|nr:hypothetical protein [Bacteroidota bacterium]
MEIKGKIHCFFEQSGTFKNEFRKLGYEAEDYDIQNEFGETDHVMDLFAEIEKCYDGEASIFDNITPNDLIMAFFPCIYFCETSQMAFKTWHYNYRKLDTQKMYDKILERIKNRAYFFSLLNKLFCIVKIKGLRMIVENPWSGIAYLKNNFDEPAMIDNDRTKRGDFYKKPTAYWFVGCERTYGCSYQKPKFVKTIRKSKSAIRGGGWICSTERSMISPDYARNFICDFIIGKKQKITEQTLF